MKSLSRLFSFRPCLSQISIPRSSENLGRVFSRGKIDTLTTLRLVAALFVVAHHSRGTLLPISVAFPGGEAVSFFFVLSGFILVYTYHQRTYSLKSFYLARVARIYPASILSVLVYILLIGQYGSSYGLIPFVFVSHIFLAQSLIPIPAFYFALNAVLWSVSVEVFFYLLFPALDRLLKNVWGRVILVMIPLILASLLVYLSTVNHYPNFSAASFRELTWHGLVYISPLSRLKEFVIGMAAGALFIRSLVRSVSSPGQTSLFTVLEASVVVMLFLGLPFVNSLMIKNLTMFQSDPQIPALALSQILAAIFFATTIFIFAFQGGVISRLLRNKVMVTGGEISFSVYLFHQIFVIWQYYNPWALGWCFEGLRFPLFLFALLAFSYAVWRWFECPMRSLVRRAFDPR